MDDRERSWLERYRQGDVNALGMLVEQYRRTLYAFILRMTEGRVDADEIFQEVWARAIKRLDRFDDRNLLGWLFRIAHNLVIDQGRRKRAVVEAPAEPDTRTRWIDRAPDARVGPATEAAGRDLGGRIRRAMARLPPEQREVFLMRMEGDIPFKEIARVQGVSINTALARMHYALGKLRQELQSDYDAFARS